MVQFLHYSYSWILLFTYLVGLTDWLFVGNDLFYLCISYAVIHFTYSFYSILYRLFLFQCIKKGSSTKKYDQIFFSSDCLTLLSG